MPQAKTTTTPMLDLFGTPEYFATEMAALENLGPCYRLVFTVPQTDSQGTVELAPVFRVVLPAEAVKQLIATLPSLMTDLKNVAVSVPENRSQLN